MPNVEEHKLDSFTAVLKAVEDFQSKNDLSWFRGCNDSTHALVPSLFRHPSKKKVETMRELELDIARVFAQRSPPFVQQSFRDEWEQMFFMQHYGIPTRLLDWSESPLIAMYFALTGGERYANGKPKKDAAIWMLNPAMWNRGALSDISFTGGVLDTSKEQVRSYGPNVDLEQRKNLPVMIYGTHNSPRIVAQRGTFSLFGKSKDCMATAYKAAEFADGILHKVVVPKEKREEVALSLLKKGVSDTTIYPDLQGLSLELKKHFGF